MVCGCCGKEIPPKLSGAGFCPFCGENLIERRNLGAGTPHADEQPTNQAELPQGNTTGPKPSGQRKLPLGILGVLLAIAVLAAVLGNSDNGPKSGGRTGRNPVNRVDIIGKKGWAYFGHRGGLALAAVDEKAMDDWIDLAEANDTVGTRRMADQGKLVWLDRNTRVLVLDVDGGVDQVRVISNTSAFYGRRLWIDDKDVWSEPAKPHRIDPYRKGEVVRTESECLASKDRDGIIGDLQHFDSFERDGILQELGGARVEILGRDRGWLGIYKVKVVSDGSYMWVGIACLPPKTGPSKSSVSSSASSSSPADAARSSSHPESTQGGVRPCQPYGAPFLGTDIPHGPFCSEDLVTGKKVYTIPSTLLQNYRSTVLRGWSHICVPYLSKQGLEAPFVTAYNRREAALLKKIQSFDGLRFYSLGDAERQINMLGSDVGKLTNAVVEDPQMRKECQPAIRKYLGAAGQTQR